VVGISSEIQHENFINLVDKNLPGLGYNYEEGVTQKKPESPYQGGEVLVPSSSGKSQVSIAFQGAAIGSKDAPALAILREVLGGGRQLRAHSFHHRVLTSLLNRNVTSQPFVHESYAFNYNHSDSGLFGVVAIGDEGSVNKLVDLLISQIHATKNISDSQFEIARNLAKARVLRELESSHGTLNFFSRQLLGSEGKITPPNQYVSSIESVTKQQLIDVAKKIFSSQSSFAASGDIENVVSHVQIQKKLNN